MHTPIALIAKIKLTDFLQFLFRQYGEQATPPFLMTGLLKKTPAHICLPPYKPNPNNVKCMPSPTLYSVLRGW